MRSILVSRTIVCILVLLSGCVKKTPEPFVHGLNVAWVDFGRDIGTGTPPTSDLRSQFQGLSRMTKESCNGVARLFLHADARLTPEFNSLGYVISPGTLAIKDLVTILDIAAEKGIRLLPVLWSYDLLEPSQSREILERNKRLFTDDSVLESYLEKALKPMVEAVDGHPGLYGWEVMNKPDALDLPMTLVQRFVGKQVAAIRKAAQRSIVVTTGLSSAKYLSIFADKALKETTGDSLAYLSLFQIHFYELMSEEYNPFLKQASAFKVDDKPILVGAFYPSQWRSFGLRARRQMYYRLEEKGYAGAFALKDEPTELGPVLEAIGYNREYRRQSRSKLR